MNSLFLFIYIAFFTTTQTYSINVTVNNIKQPNGELVIAVFDNEENYLTKETVIAYYPVEKEGTVDIKLSLPPGTYAIAVFHDLNGNKELDKNFAGIPKEGFGFSNKSIGFFGPPDFSDTKFSVSKNNQTVKVELKHF